MTGVPLFLFAFLVSSWEMDGKAEHRWLGTSPCDNERTIALRANALRAYEGKSSELIPPGPRSRVGTVVAAGNLATARVQGHGRWSEDPWLYPEESRAYRSRVIFTASD